MLSGPPAEPAAPTLPAGSAPSAVPLSGEMGEISGEISGGATGTTPARRSWTAPLLLGAAGVLALLVALFGPGLMARGTGELRIPGAGLTTVLRTVLFGALALHLGELLAPQLIRPVRGRPRTAVRSWAVLASLAGAAAAAGQIVRLAAVSDLGITETYGTREGGLLLLTANAWSSPLSAPRADAPPSRWPRSPSSSARRPCAPTRRRTARSSAPPSPSSI